MAASVLGLSALGGCGKAASAPRVGGETHWLQHCGEGNPGFDCGPGLECLCGVCTAACSDDASCGADGAVCAEAAVTAYAAGCEDDAPPRLCVASSDVLLVTSVKPPEPIHPNPVSGYCGGGLFSTEVGCISCSEVRSAVQARAFEIQDKYDSCRSDDDCQLITLSNNCDPTCGVATNRESVDALLAEMSELTSAYCRAPARWPEQCGRPALDCGEQFAACDGSRCYVSGMPNPCRGRPLDQCEDGGCTVARGRLYDLGNRCFSAESQAIRCVRRNYECPSEPTPAVDAAGNCYVLDGECIPDTFQAASPADPCNFALDKACAN